MNETWVGADQKLRTRAARVIPGGMWGHQNAARLPAAYPQFFSRGEGCRIFDADGRGYIDFMCAWGPMVVGYAHPAVDAAAARQTSMGDALNGPTARLVELAELMVETIPHADWAMFQKNGTDATTACVMIARAEGKRKTGTTKRALRQRPHRPAAISPASSSPPSATISASRTNCRRLRSRRRFARCATKPERR